jgi:hypothetical protein
MHDLFSNTTISIPTVVENRKRNSERKSLETILGEVKVDIGKW